MALRNFLAGFLVGTAALVLGAVGYLRLGLVDIRSDAVMPAWVARFLYIGIHGSVHREAAKVQNPLPVNDETLIAGAKLYLNDCVGCHGEPNKPRSEFGASFYPPAPQFPSRGTNYAEAEVFWIVKHGIRRTGMAAQTSSYTDQQLWTLAAFIARLPNLPPTVADGIRENPAN